MPWKTALRDLGLLLLTLGLWRTDAALRASAGSGATLVAVAAGVLATVCGYLVHEWGHLLGAHAGRSLVHLPGGFASLFLFRFDSDRNTRRQFLLMSAGGFLASALVVALFVCVLPWDALSGRVALVLTGLGVLTTAALELPPAWRVWHGAPIPRGAAYESSRRSATG